MNNDALREKVVKIISEAQVSVFKHGSVYSTQEAKEWSTMVGADAVERTVRLIREEQREAYLYALKQVSADLFISQPWNTLAQKVIQGLRETPEEVPAYGDGEVEPIYRKEERE